MNMDLPLGPCITTPLIPFLVSALVVHKVHNSINSFSVGNLQPLPKVLCARSYSVPDISCTILFPSEKGNLSLNKDFISSYVALPVPSPQ